MVFQIVLKSKSVHLQSKRQFIYSYFRNFEGCIYNLTVNENLICQTKRSVLHFVFVKTSSTFFCNLTTSNSSYAILSDCIFNFFFSHSLVYSSCFTPPKNDYSSKEFETSQKGAVTMTHLFQFLKKNKNFTSTAYLYDQTNRVGITATFSLPIPILSVTVLVTHNQNNEFIDINIEVAIVIAVVVAVAVDIAIGVALSYSPNSNLILTCTHTRS